MVFIEYVMLAGVNDTLRAGASRSRELLDPRDLQGQPDPVQPDRRCTTAPRRGAIGAFKAVLEEHGVRATVRLTRGRDIDAACGQLRR